ncbi:glucose-1-phosphate cytidylyltransferase [Patescibacteria group bacterium]|nr:glucose-1-phosphate cytidylyltransferase [Patescibacteria group bacterium]
MKVVILCGGKGTRLREETEYKPKPLVLIGGKPILWHIMKIYSHYGYNDFILCLGYKADMIKDYFLRLHESVNDFTLDFNYPKPKTIIHGKNHDKNWKITFVDTGLETEKGGRIAQIKKYITDQDFFLTYGDGVGDLDIKKLYRLHKTNNKIVTVTGVRLSMFGGRLEIKDDTVKAFEEKPTLRKEWLNGGFFVCNKKIFDYLSEDKSCVFEEDVLPQLAKEGQMSVYKHNDFWYTMNTYKESEELNKMWNSGKAAWKIWK